jgi:hypothetical protein
MLTPVLKVTRLEAISVEGGYDTFEIPHNVWASHIPVFAETVFPAVATSE